MTSDWNKYQEATKTRPPSPLLREAVTFVVEKNSALDLGAGALVDAKYLLSEGFKEVVAIDIEQFKGDIDSDRFKFLKLSFEEYSFPSKHFDLVNANFSLPFTKPESFSAVWGGIKQSLKVRGIFSGQLFGVRDDWSKNPAMSFHNTEQVRELLKGEEILKLEEIEKDGPTATSGPKHWHIFAIIFRKNQSGQPIQTCA